MEGHDTLVHLSSDGLLPKHPGHMILPLTVHFSYGFHIHVLFRALEPFHLLELRNMPVAGLLMLVSTLQSLYTICTKVLGHICFSEFVLGPLFQ